MKYPVNLIIFDFDGVIIDSGRDIASAVQHVLKLFDQPGVTGKWNYSWFSVNGITGPIGLFDGKMGKPACCAEMGNQS